MRRALAPKVAKAAEGKAEAEEVVVVDLAETARAVVAVPDKQRQQLDVL
jgi:hypothetical protein